MIALREINIIKLFNRSINKKFSENYLSEDYHLKSVIPIWVLVLRTSGSYLFSKNPDDPKAQFGASTNPQRRHALRVEDFRLKSSSQLSVSTSWNMDSFGSVTTACLPI